MSLELELWCDEVVIALSSMLPLLTLTTVTAALVFRCNIVARISSNRVFVNSTDFGQRCLSS